MEIVLIAFLVLETVYLIYSDYQNRKERKDLQLKLMSRNLTEYVSAVDVPKDVNTPEEPETHIPLEEVSAEDLIKAIDKS